MAHTFALEAQALWKILLVALVLGAGLPAVFALGVRSLAFGRSGTEAGDPGAGGALADPRPHPLGNVLAAVCFIVVLAVVAVGILFIVVTGFGHALSFAHGYPTIVDKS